MSAPWEAGARVLRRTRLLLGAGLLVAVPALADPLAAAVLVVGLGCVLAVLHRRSRSRVRAAAALAVAGVMAVGVGAALTVPSYRSGRVPLVVVDPAAATPLGPGATASRTTTAQGRFEAMGFVVSDDDGAAQAVDQNVAALSTLAATGVTLSTTPGSLVAASSSDAAPRAHVTGAGALVVVSNYAGGDFDGRRAARAMATEPARQRFASALSKIVATGGWDGVVLDLERLPPEVRPDLPLLVQKVKATLGRARRVVLAVPAYTDRADPDRRAFDLPALARAADSIVLMAYDQHELRSGPGPIAALGWVRQAQALAAADVPRRKLLLGVASYGYLWPAQGAPAELTVAQARRLPGRQVWDAAAGEMHVALPDGGQAWYDDGRAVRSHVALARRAGWAGVAVWRLGAGDPLSPGSADRQLGGPVVHRPVEQVAGRSIERVHATGVVALTFDDGPDPTWTPRILRELSRLGVPATFFVLGTSAQAHPGLIRAEVAAGDVVGNHTYSHQDLSRVPLWRAKAEILGGAAVVEGITGRKPALFRSPYGAGEFVDARSSDRDHLAVSLGLHPVNWTADGLDWQHRSARDIARTVVSEATDRTVVLLHDGGGDRSRTLAALPLIVEQLRARGYQFATTDALDGSLRAPYVERRGAASVLRGLAVIAAFRLDMAARTLAWWLLLAMGAVALLRFALALPLAVVHRRRHRRLQDRPDRPLPRVTVLVPAHNEERVIGRTLASVLALRPAADEVIVVDDGSTDATATVAGHYPVRLIRQAKAGKARALNAGIAASSGEVVVVLDADTQIGQSFLGRIVRHFADPRVGAVAGNVKVGNRHGLLPRLQALEYLVSLNLDRRAQAVLNTISVVPGAAGAFRHAALREVGGYPTDTLVEDADVTVALLAAGWRIPYEPAAHAYTEAPATVRDVLRQRRRWSYGTVQLVAKHRSRLLDRRAGRVGMLTLPWLVLTQVLVPLLGPLVEAFLLYLVLVGQWRMALAMLALALLADLLTSAAAIGLDREDWSLLPGVLALRLVWRPLLLWSSLSSARAWLRGELGSWRRLVRRGTVLLTPTG